MKRLALLAAICLASPSLADEAHLNGMAEAVLASEWAEPANVDDDLFNPIGFDHPLVQSSFLLDASPFDQVLSTFGGTIHTEEIFEGSPVIWSCYETGSGRTTFVSLAIGDGDDTIEPPIAPGPVLNLVVEEAGAPANPACSDGPAAAAPLPGNGIPRLGATRQDLFARFGGHLPEPNEPLAYVSHAELGDEDSWDQTKVIYYRLEDGIVTGVAYKLTTAIPAAFGGFIEDAVTGQFAGAGEFEKRDAPRVGLVQTGALDISLEQTSMASVLSAYGGTLHDTGEAGGRVLWICYALPGATVWFYSDGEMGGGNVTAIGGQVGWPDRAWGCSLAPYTLRYVQLDIPGLGVEQSELDTKFAPLAPDDQGRLAFTSQSPHPVLAGFSIVQDVAYRIGADGKVDAMAVVQMTGD